IHTASLVALTNNRKFTPIIATHVLVLLKRDTSKLTNTKPSSSKQKNNSFVSKGTSMIDHIPKIVGFNIRLLFYITISDLLLFKLLSRIGGNDTSLLQKAKIIFHSRNTNILTI